MPVSIIVIAEARRSVDSCQLPVLVGLLFAKFAEISVCHRLARTFCKLNGLVGYVYISDILPKPEEIEGGNVTAEASVILFGIGIELIFLPDSEDLLTSLYSQDNSGDRSA